MGRLIGEFSSLDEVLVCRLNVPLHLGSKEVKHACQWTLRVGGLIVAVLLSIDIPRCRRCVSVGSSQKHLEVFPGRFLVLLMFVERGDVEVGLICLKKNGWKCRDRPFRKCLAYRALLVRRPRHKSQTVENSSPAFRMHWMG